MAMRWVQFMRTWKWHFLIVSVIFLSSSSWALTYTSPAHGRDKPGRYFLLSQNPSLDEQEYNLAPSIGLGFGRSYGSGSGSGGQFQSSSTMVASGILAIIPGFGLGHVVQGRWTHDGWRYTLGELGSVGIMAVGAVGKSDELFVAGVLSFLYFKVAEVVSIFGGSHMPGLRWLASHSSPCQLTHDTQPASSWAWCFQQTI